MQTSCHKIDLSCPFLNRYQVCSGLFQLMHLIQSNGNFHCFFPFCYFLSFPCFIFTATWRQHLYQWPYWWVYYLCCADFCSCVVHISPPSCHFQAIYLHFAHHYIWIDLFSRCRTKICSDIHSSKLKDTFFQSKHWEEPQTTSQVER